MSNVKKYRRKPIFVDAEPYVDGLEDGFYQGIPYITAGQIKIKISPGDYIATRPDGARFLYEPKNFEATYEEVENMEDTRPICPDCKTIMVKTRIELSDGSGWFSGWGCDCKYEPKS